MISHQYKLQRVSCYPASVEPCVENPNAVPKTSSGLCIKIKRPPKQTVSPPTTTTEGWDPVQVIDSNNEQCLHPNDCSFQIDDSSNAGLEDVITKQPCGCPPKVWVPVKHHPEPQRGEPTGEG